jgi:hypothetical protein
LKRWAGYVACIAEMKSAYKILVKYPEGKDRLGDADLDGKILKHTLNK